MGRLEIREAQKLAVQKKREQQEDALARCKSSMYYLKMVQVTNFVCCF